jgi:hypothetical protein
MGPVVQEQAFRHEVVQATAQADGEVREVLPRNCSAFYGRLPWIIRRIELKIVSRFAAGAVYYTAGRGRSRASAIMTSSHSRFPELRRVL